MYTKSEKYGIKFYFLDLRLPEADFSNYFFIFHQSKGL